MKLHQETPHRLVLTAAVAVGILSLPITAAAHVTVQAPDATQGGYTKLTFRAPTEKDVPTTKLEIALPEDNPIASVRVKSQPGWTYKLTKGAPAEPFEVHGSAVTEVVERITWTATDDGIGPDEFAEFEVSAGPMPATDRLVFKALQTYADGEVVRWIEEQVPGGEEPQHPAPTLELVAATESEDSAPTAPAQAASTGGGTSNALLGTALGVSLLALAAAALAIVQSRRKL
jgi:uncharacterized protein